MLLWIGISGAVLWLFQAVACSGGWTEVWWVKERTAQIPGVTVLGWNGNEGMFDFGGVLVTVRLPGDRFLKLDGLGYKSFDNAPRLLVEMVGPYGHAWDVRGWACERRSLSDRRLEPTELFAADIREGAFARQLGITVRNVQELIERYGDVERMVLRWPQCPAYADTIDHAGRLIRYCRQAYGEAWETIPAPDCDGMNSGR